MCFSNPAPAAAPPPPPAPAPPAASNPIAAGENVGGVNPVMNNIYDPSNPESGMASEKGSLTNKAKGTSQLKVQLDPTMQFATGGSSGTGLQINN